MSQAKGLPSSVSSLKMLALVVGVVGLAAAGFGYTMDHAQFATSYLFSYLFWLGLGLGSMGLLMLHHLVGGGWGFSIQRLLEAAVKTVPIMFLFALPVLFSIHDLYEWSHREVVAKDHILRHKEIYLNDKFFMARTVLYFVIWTAMAMALTGWSKKQDDSSVDPGAMVNKLKFLSGPGIVIYFLTMTFASFDWGMSRDPHWFSTIWGVIFVVGQALSAMAFMIIMLSLVKDHEPKLHHFANVERIHDLGKLLLAFTMLWAYTAVSQYLIIWMANLPEEIGWYIIRSENGWEMITTAVVLGQFVIPFLLLLSRWPKRNIKLLRLIAGFILVVRFIDLYWLVIPTPHHTELHLHWMDFVTPIGIGGIWVFLFINFLGKTPLVSARDPRFEELSHVAH